MKDLWDRLETWTKNARAGSLKLRPGATKKDLAAAEKKLGMKFPDDFRDSLLLHDGQESDPTFPWMPGCSPLAPLHTIVTRYEEERGMDEDQRVIKEVSDDGKHKLGLWYPKRIPIAGSQWWDGDNTYLDFEPGPKGAAGQVTTFVTECDLVVLGASFREAVEKYVVLLETGKLRWDDNRQDVFPKAGDWSGNPAEHLAKLKAGGKAAKPAAKKPAAKKPAAAAKKPAKGGRRFEMVAGTSSKFWEVRVVGSTLSVTFGRLGTDGTRKDKKLASPAAAAKEAEKLVREKTGKGYVQV